MCEKYVKSSELNRHVEAKPADVTKVNTIQSKETAWTVDGHLALTGTVA